MPRLRITLAYDGAAFAGSQVQPGQRTVQGVVDGALTTLDGQPVRSVFAGRTDTGVHALAQVAHADVSRARAIGEWRQGLNGILPRDVRVTNLAVAGDRFHARYDARWREYRYTVWNGEILPPLLRGMAWHRRRPLDMAAMNRAAGALIGERDFAAFAGAAKGLPERGVKTVRTMRRVAWTAARCLDGIPGNALVFTIEGSGFLPHMVRNIVGSLVVIGSGDAPVTWIEALLAGRDRRLAAATAPPHGLCLWRVRYENEEGDAAGAGDTGDVSECRQ